jgi:endoglucanase
MSSVRSPSLFLFIIAVSLVICSCSCLSVADEPNAIKSTPDPFKMNKLLGRGINLGNALEGPNEGEWGVTLQEEYFQLIKDAGFNSIRLPVRWSAHAANVPPYTIDPNFLKRVDWAIQNTLSRKMVMVFTTHYYYELYSDPNGHKERYLALWKQIAEHYKDYPDTLFFEPLNEPTDKLGVGEWNTLLKEVLVVIRKSNPNRTVVIGTANLGRIYAIKSLELPREDRNIIVTFHYYLPHRFTHQGVSWEKDSDKWLGMKWTGSEDEKRLVVKDLDLAANWAKENDRPIYLGEFGVYEKADMDSRARWTKCVAEAAVERGFSFAYWQFTSNFVIYDTEKKTWIKPILDSVIPPAVSEVEPPKP